jgi:hypothetical protein
MTTFGTYKVYDAQTIKPIMLKLLEVIETLKQLLL